MVTGSDGLVRAAEWRRVGEFAVGIGAREESALLAIAGEAGAGKSTLWRAGIAAAAEAGCRVLRSEPSASDAEAPFAGLSDLLSGVLPGVAGGIPGPQREVLEVALLLRPAGDTRPTAHAVGLAMLAALRSCLDAGPVLVAIDDVQWLDAGSTEALAFAGTSPRWPPGLDPICGSPVPWMPRRRPRTGGRPTPRPASSRPRRWRSPLSIYSIIRRAAKL